MGDEFNEENQFVTDEVSMIIRESVETILGYAEYNNDMVKQWTSSILDTTMTGLIALQKPFKYTINCAIMQKTGAGLHTSSSCYWDNATDGCCTVRWENKYSTVVVTVFALCL